jgi:hypothetical protein
MKRPSFFWHKLDKDYDGNPGIGLEWLLCREGPLTTIERPDQEYYDYIIFKLKFGYYCLDIDVYYKKMPYRNLDEYISFRRLRK